MQAASAEVAPVPTSEPEVLATLASAAEPQAEPAAEPAAPVEVAVEKTPAPPAEIVPEVAAEAATEALPVAPEVVSEAIANDEAPKVEEPGAPQESPAAVAESETSPQAAAEAPAPETQPSRNDDDVMAAIASLAPSSALGSEDVSLASNANGSGHGTPVAAMAVEAEIAGPRWVAEAVAVTAEESALVLEQEMERASTVTAVAEAVSVDQAPPPVAETPAPVAETVEPTVEAVASVAEAIVESVAAESVPAPTISESNPVEAISQNRRAGSSQRRISLCGGRSCRLRRRTYGYGRCDISEHRVAGLPGKRASCKRGSCITRGDPSTRRRTRGSLAELEADTGIDRQRAISRVRRRNPCGRGQPSSARGAGNG